VLSAPIAATAKINKNKRSIISKFTIFDYWAEFAAEKRDAFIKLADFIDRMIHPSDNVITLPKRG